MVSSEKMCSRCVMPARCPSIRFDDKGICNFCKQWDQIAGDSGDRENQTLLQSVLEKVKKKSASFDCVTGLSGGKDSCYALYLANNYGLRQLAVTFDNGFLSDESLLNIKNIVNHLCLDHIIIKPAWDYLKKLYRHCLLETGEFCSVCNVGIRAALYRAAALYSVRTIIMGTSPLTDAVVPDEFFCTSNDYFYNVFKGVLSHKQIINYMYVTSQIQRALWHFSGRLCWVQLPRYTPWKEKQMLSVLSEKIGWRGTLWQEHTDCRMSDAKEYLQVKRFGFPEKAAKLSALVRDGQIARKDALEALEKLQTSLHEQDKMIYEKIAITFELTSKEMDHVLSKNHWPYLPKRAKLFGKLKDKFYK